MSALGMCSGDLSQLASYINEAQQRLINCGGETGWANGWARMVFSVSRSDPYITSPPEFARIISLNACRNAIGIQNEFYETLEAGIGLQSGFDICMGGGIQEAYSRQNLTTDRDLDATNQLIRVYLTDPRDAARRVLVTGAKDQNGNGIYTTDGGVTVNGFYLALQTPFNTTGYIVTSFTGVSKDLTYGDVLVKQVDATTGVEVLLARYTPDETNPSYRRYYLNQLPSNCCTCPSSTPANPTAQVTALAKYEFIPVARPTDFLLIGNIPALKAECESIRYGEMDSLKDIQLSAVKHALAIKLLNDEIVHYGGRTNPAIVFAPFGTAKLEHQRIGTLL